MYFIVLIWSVRASKMRSRLISLNKIGLNFCKRVHARSAPSWRLFALQRNTDAARAELDGPVQCRRFHTRDLPEATALTTAAVAAAVTTTTLTSALSASAVSSSTLIITSVAPAVAAAALATSIAALATT